ncbi:5-formyltetrahydrofolate cyclo-ligase [Psychromicrobium xiongbiense]|uniref:5-formyltetrahydrofolate cyclo-ligase n=1 Tax=Psychromicrobium xiongbiense TaxID=3051184 RepID=UPI0025531D0C|nr:5-formyltetrahydrofolate cyclo-ligase [Psychromicrobium sp. YIM S02556]
MTSADGSPPPTIPPTSSAVAAEQVAAAKATQRSRLRAARRHRTVSGQDSAGLSAEGLALLSSLMSDDIRAVAAFLPGPEEPPLGTLFEALTAQGTSIYLPVCEPGFRLSWTLWWPGEPLVRSTLAPVWEPVGERLGVEVMERVGGWLIPALAVTADGVRLGYGGGYYDRFMALVDRSTASHQVPRIAVVFTDEVLPAGSIPHTAQDLRVDAVLTPEFRRELGPEAGSSPAG